MKSIIFIAVWTLSSVYILAQSDEMAGQDKSQKALGLRAGFQSRHLLDEQKSALTYQSTEIFAGVFYRRETQRSFLYASLSAGKGKFIPDGFNHRWIYTTEYDIYGVPKIDSVRILSQLISADIQFTWFWKFGSGKTDWMAGTTVREMLLYTDNNTGLFNSLGIALTLRASRQIGNKSDISAALSVPLISLTTRLPWHNTATSPDKSESGTFFKKGSRLTGPSDLRMVKLDLEYNCKVLPGISLGAAYSFTYMHLTYFQTLKSYMNSIQIQTIYRL